MDIENAESIRKSIYKPNKELTLSHLVIVGNSDNKGNLVSPISMYEYNSTKYSNTKNLINIIVNTADYLSLKLKKGEENPIEIVFSYPHMYNLTRIMKECLDWFYEDEYKDLFIEKDNKLMLNRAFKKECRDIYNLPRGKALRFAPVVLYGRDEIDMYEGIRIYFNSDIDFTDLTIDEFENLYQVIDHFDLYNSSINLMQVTSSNYSDVKISNTHERKMNNFSKLENKNRKKKKQEE